MRNATTVYYSSITVILKKHSRICVYVWNPACLPRFETKQGADGKPL